MNEEQINENFRKIVAKIQEIDQRVTILEETLGSKIAGNVDVLGRVERLEKTVSGHGTLLIDLREQEAVDLHTSFPVKNENDDENTGKNREWKTDLKESAGVLGVSEKKRGEGNPNRDTSPSGETDRSTE